MHRLLRVTFFLGAIAYFAADEKPAQAQYWGWPGLYGPTIYTLDRIPYFAQFPPVYYSHAVPRPYGYSPYAYPPGYITPERPQVVRQIVVNPYASFKATTPAQPAQEPKPLVVKNPFVKP